MNIKNPFRNKIKKEQFEKVVAAYFQKKPLLFMVRPDIGVCGRAGNGWASCFWAGYDGMTTGVRVPPAVLPVFAFYKAGLLIRTAERAALQEVCKQVQNEMLERFEMIPENMNEISSWCYNRKCELMVERGF